MSVVSIPYSCLDYFPSEANTAYQLNRYVSIGALKHYFNVTTPYVLRKLLLVLFPWRHKPWSRQQRPSATSSQESSTYSYYFLPPRDDLNSPDMYIPVMAIVTYILLSTLLAGLRGQFHPEVMGLSATAAFAVVAIEILGLKFGTYILSISNDSQLLDLVAYSGYKFVGVIVTLVLAEILNGGKGSGGWAGWAVFTYTFLANAFFLVSFFFFSASSTIQPPFAYFLPCSWLSDFRLAKNAKPPLNTTSSAP